MRPPQHLPAPDLRFTKGIVIRLALLILLLIAALQSISFYVESLWYGSLGFESVYWYRLRTQSLVFLAFGSVTAIVLWTIFRLVTPPPGYTRRPFLQFGQEAIVIPTTDTLTRLAKPVAIILGVFFGLAFSSEWNTCADRSHFWPAAIVLSVHATGVGRSYRMVSGHLHRRLDCRNCTCGHGYARNFQRRISRVLPAVECRRA